LKEPIVIYILSQAHSENPKEICDRAL